MVAHGLQGSLRRNNNKNNRILAVIQEGQYELSMEMEMAKLSIVVKISTVKCVFIYSVLWLVEEPESEQFCWKTAS